MQHSISEVHVRCKDLPGTAIQYTGNNVTDVKKFLNGAGDVAAGDDGNLRVTCPVTGKTASVLVGFWLVTWDQDGSVTLFSPGSFRHQMNITSGTGDNSFGWVAQARAAGWLPPEDVADMVRSVHDKYLRQPVRSPERRHLEIAARRTFERLEDAG